MFFNRYDYLTMTNRALKTAPIATRVEMSVYYAAALRTLSIDVARITVIFFYELTFRH